MERVWFVLRMGGGEGLHHGEDKQARHVQVNIQDGKLELSRCSHLVLTHRTLNGYLPNFAILFLFSKSSF